MRYLLCSALLIATAAHAKKIQTNAANFPNAPEWLERTRVETVIDHVQLELEWTTRRIQVHWHNTQADFEKIHSLGSVPVAVAKKSRKKQEIHLGPRVTTKNFDRIFGHEMVHIIFYQKYKGAIPEWLEEGLANHIGKKRKVDYQWLAKQPFPPDIRKLTHPYKGKKSAIKYHYIASQAVAEMLEKECNLENLLRLSVQRKMKDYIKTYCEIKDINAAFRKWVAKRSK